MRLDLVLPNEGDAALEALNAGAYFEDMGWDGLWVTDHLIGLDAYQPTYGNYWLEILIAMTHLAATTKRARIGVGVMVVPYRNAVVTAKQLATMDVLSGGRIDLGIGTGWARREYIAVDKGHIFDQRGPFTDEVLDVMLACWKGGQVNFEGKWHNFKKVNFEPTPVRNNRVPIWVGMRQFAPAPMRRAAKYADVWHPTGVTPEQVREGGERLDELAGRRIPRSLRIRMEGDPSMLADKLHAYKEAGCMTVVVNFDQARTFGELDRCATALYEAAKSLQKD